LDRLFRLFLFDLLYLFGPIDRLFRFDLLFLFDLLYLFGPFDRLFP
jgi:hypothetical protein